MTYRDVSLDDKYDLSKNEIFLTGTQAVVRLTIMQHARDEKQGLNTGGFVTGYRGSPVGGLDQQFERAARYIAASNVIFQPGLNEDLAATAIWGTQQAEMRGEGKGDGVFGIWYGKGPGVDRSGDVFRHANSAGTSKYGGVLAITGDDHAAESSTVPHQSEFALMDAMMPILNPAGVQEILDYGIYGFALSRFCGCWVGLKAVHDNIEATAIVDGSVDRIKIRLPEDFAMPPGGLNIRASDDRHEMEVRLHTHKRFAATAFARANNLDQIIMSGGDKARIGVVSTGKSWLDVRQALSDLGIDEERAGKLGVRLLKIAMVWPLDPVIIADFARGLDLIIVVEEKRSLLETQIREQLYDANEAPAIIGKRDEAGLILFPAFRTLEPNEIAIVLAERILKIHADDDVKAKLQAVRQVQGLVRNTPDLAARVPYFCAGCPHNTSTKVPEGGRAYAGIGCHWMAQAVPGRRTEGATHMGGEGANWFGEAPFSTREHIFQNIGDGTYNHSGSLAIRAAVASGVNITYKVLYNDAVAMTGGQAHDGGLSVPKIARQVRAEGVERIAIVSDEPGKYSAHDFPPNVSFNHRDDLNAVQKQLMQVKGTSVLIYDQTCAAEKRRRRKRGLYPDPDERLFINELVCEGCGDCGVQSNCVAITPVETEFGRKRQIDQDMCNKDFSCVKGFCPSFVTVRGGKLKQRAERNISGDEFGEIDEPQLPSLETPWSILVTGIGGTGVVTIGQLLGMAARVEGKGAGIIDMAGLAQKNGAVVTHLKIAARPEDISTIRLAAGATDLVLGCDLVTSASERNLSRVSQGRTHAVINDFEVMPAQFATDADFNLPADAMRLQLQARMSSDQVHFVDATRIATALLGNSIAANLFTLGYAYQKGLVPVSAGAIERAIELNGVAVEMNQKAFAWGRRAAHDLAAVEKIIGAEKQVKFLNLDQMVNERAEFLCEYQNNAYGEKYRRFVNKVRQVEADLGLQDKLLSRAVARYLFKLMAFKDEFEVSRLYSNGWFDKAVAARFTGDYKLQYHLASPILASKDADSGLPRKSAYGQWMARVFALLARMRFLRGTIFDVFGHKEERARVDEYRAVIDQLLNTLSVKNIDLAVEIASIPEHIRGYGHIRDQHAAKAMTRQAELLKAYRSGSQKVVDAMAAE